MVLYNPSAHTKVLAVVSPNEGITAGSTETVTDIDATGFEYVAVFVAIGTTGATLDVTISNATAAGGTYTAVTTPANTSTLSFTATDDNKGGAMEARIHSGAFVRVNFAAGAGTDVVSLGAIVVGFTPQYGTQAGGEDSPDFNTLVTATAPS